MAKKTETANEELVSEDQARVEAFWKEYGELVKKYQVDIMSMPVYSADGNGGYITKIQAGPVDIKDESVPSPFIPTSDAETD